MEKKILKESKSYILGAWWNLWRTGADSKADGTVYIGRSEEGDFVHGKSLGAGLQEEETWNSSESSEYALKIVFDFLSTLGWQQLKNKTKQNCNVIPNVVFGGNVFK